MGFSFNPVINIFSLIPVWDSFMFYPLWRHSMSYPITPLLAELFLCSTISEKYQSVFDMDVFVHCSTAFSGVLYLGKLRNPFVHLVVLGSCLVVVVLFLLCVGTVSCSMVIILCPPSQLQIFRDSIVTLSLLWIVRAVFPFLLYSYMPFDYFLPHWHISAWSFPHFLRFLIYFWYH